MYLFCDYCRHSANFATSEGSYKTKNKKVKSLDTANSISKIYSKNNGIRGDNLANPSIKRTTNHYYKDYKDVSKNNLLPSTVLGTGILGASGLGVAALMRNPAKTAKKAYRMINVNVSSSDSLARDLLRSKKKLGKTKQKYQELNLKTNELIDDVEKYVQRQNSPLKPPSYNNNGSNGSKKTKQLSLF